MEREKLKSIIECLLFFSDKPLGIDKLTEIIEADNCDEIKGAVEELEKEYDLRNSGLQVLNIAEGYQICTRSEFSSWVRKLHKSQTTFQLSLPALETLSIIAYKQPVTRGEIEKIRGVDASCVLRTLLEKKLIKEIKTEYGFNDGNHGNKNEWDTSNITPGSIFLMNLSTEMK
ncbi:SMC-Scp complex subunit ScpB, partial [bacterium]|nr:SMC-Scp complex subunit ScpB [bacterium]